MRFDWYQTTIQDKNRVVVDQLSKLGHELLRVPPRHHYTDAYQVLHKDRGAVATVWLGGKGVYPHAFASSDDTDAFVDLVRGTWPDRHLVTRLDAAQDFNEARAYDRLRPVTRRIAKRHRLKFPKYVDDLNPMAGRTQYVGGTSSDYRVRLYEKGWEQVAKLLAGFKSGIPIQCIDSVTNKSTGEKLKPENWTRIELQVRPRQEEGRRVAAVATPEQVWGFSTWTHELALEAMALDLERICIRTKRVSKDDVALAWMCRQYGSLLMRLRDDLGDFSAVGKQIEYVIQEQAAYRDR
jgi:DNA relaxase NicK